MRIIIAGPLPTKEISGGVAVFTSNLAQEAVRLGNQVLVLTKRPHKNAYPFNVESIWNLKAIRNFKADVLISSLDYSLIISFFNLKCKKIHILHGFTNFKSYSLFKLCLMHCIDKYIREKFNVLLSNSEFTRDINEEIYDIKSDGTFSIGIEEAQLNKIMSSSKTQEKKNLLYVGRIVPAKGVEKAIKAFILSNSGQNFNIVGYGAELSKLKKDYFNWKSVIFLGPIGHNRIQDIYEHSKAFISLNPFEPFGITYEEAIANGLFVIAPKTGGQVDFLKQFPGRYKLVDPKNTEEVSEAINEGLSSDLKPLSKKILRTLSYKKTFLSIIKFIK